MDVSKIKKELEASFAKSKLDGLSSWEAVNELSPIYNKLEVNPKNYSKPVRIYCDIDGVLAPFPEFSKEAIQNYYDNHVELTEDDVLNKDKLINKAIELPQRYSLDFDLPLFEKTSTSYSDEAVKIVRELAEITDFIWLTSWREFAPLTWDRYFDIESIGYLYWEQKMSDYNHTFKGVAVIEDQKKYPSKKFIWIDDHANKDYKFKGYLNNYKDGLIITTDSYKGLTNEHYDKIIDFINS